MALASLLTAGLSDENTYYESGDVGYDNLWWADSGSGSNQIPAGSMSVGASSWGDVALKGISRAFDIAGQVAIAKNVPYYQTPAGQQTVAQASQQKTIILLFIGAAVLMMIKKG